MLRGLEKIAITVYREPSVSRSRIDTNIVKRVLRQSCKKARCPKGAEVSVIFVGDAKMRGLNRKYRGKNKTTNVLAFAALTPALSSPSPQPSPRGRGGLGGVRDLGDIFISIPEAKREAKKYGWTAQYAVARLALHGLLHLVGFNHVEDKEARKMELLEADILKHYA